MTFLAAWLDAFTSGAAATISFLPTVRRVVVRWFKDLSLSTVVLKCAAILPSVSPARTVYQVDRPALPADFVAVWRVTAADCLPDRSALALARMAAGGCTPLSGIASVWPVFRIGAFPSLLAWEI